MIFPKWVINPRGLAYRRWEKFVASISFIWYACLLPPRVAFETPDRLHISYIYIDVFTELVFLTQIILTFFVAFLDKKDKFHNNHKEIAIQYLKGFLIIDVVSLLPVSLFAYTVHSDKELSINEALLRLEFA